MESATRASQRLLKFELERRCRMNPRYSMRAFARSLGMSHTVMSLVLSGKRELSEKAAVRIADRLGLSPDRRRTFIQRSNLHHRRGALRKTSEDDMRMSVSLDHFSLIADWYHYAILSLLSLPDANIEPKWIASRLGITSLQAQLAVERLKRLNLIEPDGTGRWRQSGKPIKIENSISTAATRKFYRQLLSKASAAIDRYDFEERDLSSMTLAVATSQLPYVRDRIREFRRALTEELELIGSPDAVYQLLIQFFPLTQPAKKEKPCS